MRDAASILRMAGYLARWLPRGKGAVPRAIGKRVLRPGKYFMPTRHGAKLVMSPDSLDVYATMHANGNAWDHDDFEICYGSVPDGGVFYDVGANVGYFSVDMSARSRCRVRSIAFEPQNLLVDAIRKTAELNGFACLTVKNGLVGDRSGNARMFVGPATIHTSAVSFDDRRIVRAEDKEMFAIDDLVEAEEIPPPDMVKMDIEGSEHLAFQGAHRCFRASRPHIYLEYLHYDDTDGRVWAQVQSLMADTGCYDLYFSPSAHLRSGYPARLPRLRSPDDLQICDGVFLRNRLRP